MIVSHLGFGLSPLFVFSSLSSSNVGDVGERAEDLDELTLVVPDVALHDVHARTQETLERMDIQN